MKCEWCPNICLKKFPECFQKYGGSCQKDNPGNIQNLHYLAHKIKPLFFDGIELDYSHRIDANKIITNNWVLSYTRPSGYRVGGIYTHRFHDDVMITPTIYANINPSTLSSNLGFLFYPMNCLRVEAELQRANASVPLETQMCFELTRPCTTYTCNFYNFTRSAGRGTFSVMRAATNHLAVGAELLLEWTNNRLLADTALAARYKRYNYTVAATASRQGCDVSYWQRLHKRVQMATMLAYRRKMKKANASICYQWDFGDSIVRGKVDSELSVGFSYSRFLDNMPMLFGMSVLYNMALERFVFGMKFNLDPSGLRRGE